MGEGPRSYRSRVGNMGEGPRPYMSLAWKHIQVVGAKQITSWKMRHGFRSNISRVGKMGEGPRSYRRRVGNVYRYSYTSPYTLSCLKRAVASDCTKYRPPIQMRGDDHIHWIDHTGNHAQSPRSKQLRLRKYIY